MNSVTLFKFDNKHIYLIFKIKTVSLLGMQDVYNSRQRRGMRVEPKYITLAFYSLQNLFLVDFRVCILYSHNILNIIIRYNFELNIILKYVMSYVYYVIFKFQTRIQILNTHYLGLS